MAVVSVSSGYVNKNSVIEVCHSIFNSLIARPITLVNNCTFLVPMMSRKKVKEVCKLGLMQVSTKDGGCLLKMAPWSAKLGANGKATGVG